jgi:hypothetical protein
MGRTGNKFNWWDMRKGQESSFFFTIHRARVNSVNLDNGTVSVAIDGYGLEMETSFPLLGFSYPPKSSKSDEKNYKRTSWGRYIPQIGDFLLVGFNSNGELYSLGYTSAYYKGVSEYDERYDDKGGFRWGSNSGRRLQQGDWDFKSSRDCYFYLGNKSILGSGPLNTVWDKGVDTITTMGGLVKEIVGDGSMTLKGVAKRKKLPTDEEDSPVISIKRGPLSSAQEITNIVNYSIAGVPVELARHSIGEVIDETLKLVKFNPIVPLCDVRLEECIYGPTGNLVPVPVYTRMVDSGGNESVEALSSTMSQWLTPFCAWTITNSSTTITSTTTFAITSPSVTVTSSNIMLGGPAVSPVMKHIEFSAAFNTFLTAVSVEALKASVIAGDPDIMIAALKAAWAVLAKQCLALQGQLATMASTTTKAL